MPKSLSQSFRDMIDILCLKFNKTKKNEELSNAYRNLFQLICNFECVINNEVEKGKLHWIFENIKNNFDRDTKYDIDIRMKQDMYNLTDEMNKMSDDTRVKLNYLIKCFNPNLKLSKKIYDSILDGNIEHSLSGKLIELKFKIIMINSYIFWKELEDSDVLLNLLMKYNDIIRKEPYRYEYLPSITSFGENLRVINGLTRNANKDDLIKLMDIMYEINTKYHN